MKRVMFLVIVVNLATGCASQPMTPEERARLWQTGQAFQNMGRSFSPPAPTTQNCNVTDLGGGSYWSSCDGQAQQSNTNCTIQEVSPGQFTKTCF